jgi:6-phosphogluconate dehydrogenase
LANASANDSTSASPLQVGIVGMGTMGHNLALNMIDSGHEVIALEVSRQLRAGIDDVTVHGTFSDFLAALTGSPRVVWLMVTAGAAVDEVIKQVLPMLAAGDIIVDGGNSNYRDSVRRAATCNEHLVRFLGIGVSGGADGARHGACIMAGGDAEAFATIAALLNDAAAVTNDGPCAAMIANDAGAGHFVKMVHNGIEYADMQLIAECYDYLHRALGLTPDAAAGVFGGWRSGPLSSFLLDITETVLLATDQASGNPLVDVIEDLAGQKGTGILTSMTAMDLRVPVPTINAAVEARFLTANKPIRAAASPLPAMSLPLESAAATTLGEIESALIIGKQCAYSQGFALLRTGALEYGWRVDLAEVARIWQGGCIIRADMLREIRDVFLREPDCMNLLQQGHLDAREHVAGLRAFVSSACAAGIAVPAHASALAYADALFSARLPANLIQGQRDFFGAHGFERTDTSGDGHHHDWGRT